MKTSYYLLVIVFLLLLIGCGSQGTALETALNPDLTQGPEPQQTGIDEHEHHASWGIFKFYCDLENMEVQVVPDRRAMAHYNAAKMLTPQNCNDCVVVNILSYDPVLHEISVHVTLKNPSGLSGNFVRGILLPQVAGIIVTNAEAYTTFMASASVYTRNPYMSFGDYFNFYLFKPGETWTRTYNIKYTTFNALKNISFAVHVSYPGLCEEPWNAYSSPSVFTGAAYDQVEITIADFQANISGVWIYPWPLAGSSEYMLVSMESDDGATYRATFGNSNGVAPGLYKLWVEAWSYGTSVATWFLVDAYVQPAPQPVQDIQIKMYCAFDYDGSPPYQSSPSGDIDIDGAIIGDSIIWAQNFWASYNFQLHHDGYYYHMDKNLAYDAKFYHLDDWNEAWEMHSIYGAFDSPGKLSIYYVQSLPPGYDTAVAVWYDSNTSLAHHTLPNMMIIISPTTWFWQATVAHEGGHAFGAFEDIYLLNPGTGYDCIQLWNDSTPSHQYLNCDDEAFYWGNLMYLVDPVWPIENYSLTWDQQNWAHTFHLNYPNNF